MRKETKVLLKDTQKEEKKNSVLDQSFTLRVKKKLSRMNLTKAKMMGMIQILSIIQMKISSRAKPILSTRHGVKVTSCSLPFLFFSLLSFMYFLVSDTYFQSLFLVFL